MIRIQYVFITLMILSTAVLCAPAALGHGNPINLFVNPTTNRLEVQGEFEFGIFLDEGPFFATDRPGVQVSATSNGLAIGTAIGYVVTQGLLYWDGVAPANTAATLTVVPPVGSGYSVDAMSGLQTGITWGTYDGTAHWHRHGDFLLSSDAQDGVYGLVVQFVSANYGPSSPIVVPFALGSGTGTDVNDAIAAWTPLVQSVANPDFNNNGDINGPDLAAWSAGYGTPNQAGHGQGDADGDGDVDGLDFLAWQRATESAPLVATVALMPEPATLLLALVALSSCRRSCGRGSSARRRH